MHLLVFGIYYASRIYQRSLFRSKEQTRYESIYYCLTSWKKNKNQRDILPSKPNRSDQKFETLVSYPEDYYNRMKREATVVIYDTPLLLTLIYSKKKEI